MTEVEWLAVTDPRQWLKGVGGRVKGRRLRLCAVACCRLVAHLLPDERCLRAIDVAEAYTDRRADKQQVAQAVEELGGIHNAMPWHTCGLAARYSATGAVRHAVAAASPKFAELAVSQVAFAIGFSQLPPERSFASVTAGEVDRIDDAGCRAQLHVARDILRNPFRPLPSIPAPLPASILPLAQAGYDERHLPSGHLDPARLAILSDALEEAGVPDAALLSHLRSPGPHVRGCWAVDLLLGKE